MRPTRFLFACFLSFLFLFNAQAQTLPRSTPEAEGVSSTGILNFLSAAAASKHEFHSFMLLRHGKVIAEGWWKPYAADLRHTMYSTSKSFTSTAVGLAVSEKRLSVNDKVVSFFANDLPDSISQHLSELTVQHLLMMSAGQEPDPTRNVLSNDTNWLKGFLSTPIIHQPGSVFLYNTMATYTLSAIVQKVTGQKIIDYLKPRLFDPLGITGMDWEESPQGVNAGGWGLRIKTEDMAKLGQLYLQKGKWQGKQVLPKEWVSEATSKHILQPLPKEGNVKSRDSSDWLQGYGYQFWRCRHNAFRADGAFGQFIIMMPEQDAVVAITAETPDMQGEIDLVWKHILPAIQAQKLPSNEQGNETLKETLAQLALPGAAKTFSRISDSISTKTFAIDSNDKHLKAVTISFSNGACRLALQTDTATYKMDFGSGRWLNGTTDLPQPYLLAMLKENIRKFAPHKTAGAYRWTDPQTLELILHYVESPHSETITCHFEQQKISVDIHSTTDFTDPRPLLTGRLAQAK